MAAYNMCEFILPQPREVEAVLREIRQINPTFSPVYKKVFVSCCKEDQTDPYWINTVFQFVNCLTALGVDVSNDFLDATQGGNIAFEIANKIELCDKILMINSPEYYNIITKKNVIEDQASRSVAFEGQLIYSELFKQNGKKVIPIFLKRYPRMMIPPAFKMNINYIMKGAPDCLDFANYSIHKFTQLACLLLGINVKDWGGTVNLNSCKPIQLLDETVSSPEIYPDLDRPLSEGSLEKFFTNLVSSVIPFWKQLALQLEVDLKKVTELYSKESEKELCYQSLYQWWKRHPEATYRDLIAGLQAVIGVDTRMIVMKIEMYALEMQQQTTEKEHGQTNGHN